MGTPGGSRVGDGKDEAGTVSSLLMDLAALWQGLGDSKQESVVCALLALLCVQAQPQREQ
jgi:hypothetical protein